MQYKWAAVIVASLGALMAGIDGRIVVIGLPTIAKQLHAGAEQVVWISQAYLLASAVGLLVVGRLSDIYGKVRIYEGGFALFTLGSCLAALSSGPIELITFRIVQGTGAAILATNSSAIVADASPKNELGLLLGVSQTFWRVGSAVGLTVSGLILSVVDWRGIFYVNIPIGIVGLIWCVSKLHESTIRDSERKLDWTGLFFFSSGLTLILLALTFVSFGPSEYFFGSSFLVVGSVLIALFVRVEGKIVAPLLDLSLFKIGEFARGNLAQLLNALVWGSVILLMAFYLQIVLGYTPLRAGLAIIPLEATFIIVSVIGGKLSDKYNPLIPSILGLSVITVTLLFMPLFTESTNYVNIAIVLATIGIGNGMFTTPNSKAIIDALPPERRGIGSAFWNMMFQLGMTASFGIGVLLVTLEAPYYLFSMLLQGTVPTPLLSMAKLDFLNGFRLTTIILAAVDLVAIMILSTGISRNISDLARNRVRKITK